METTRDMLVIPEKKTVAINLYEALLHFIQKNYPDREASRGSPDLTEVKKLRTAIEEVSTVNPTYRLKMLKSYYMAICDIESKFPLSSMLNFVWLDAFKPVKPKKNKNKDKNMAVLHGVELEKAAILFNLGAVHSEIGARYDRTNMEGMKKAYREFHCAAGVFSLLKDILESSPGSSSVDLSLQCVGMCEHLMLAQANQCFYECSIAGSKSAGTSAKLSCKAWESYRTVLDAITVEPLRYHFEKKWIAHIQVKTAQLYAASCLHCSIQLHHMDEFGQEIARLRSGIKEIEKVHKLYSKTATQLREAIQRLKENMTLNLDKAVKLNNCVHSKRVPAADSLPPLPTFPDTLGSKPARMNSILIGDWQPLFARLLPLEKAVALSRYRELVDNIIETQSEKLRQASERVGAVESDVSAFIRAYEALPPNLKEAIESVRTGADVGFLEAELKHLRDSRAINQELIEQTEKMLQKECSEHEHFQSQYGIKCNMHRSSTFTGVQQDWLKKRANDLKKVAEYSAQHERYVKYQYAQVMSVIESLCRPDAIVAELKESLGQLKTLHAQLAKLVENLADMKTKDDILGKLTEWVGSPKYLIWEEISKYDYICGDTAMIIEEQQKLLMLITKLKEEFFISKKCVRGFRQKSYKQIWEAISAYQTVLTNLNAWRTWYEALKDGIVHVKKECTDFLMTSTMQRSHSRGAASLSFEDNRSATCPYCNHEHRRRSAEMPTFIYLSDFDSVHSGYTHHHHDSSGYTHHHHDSSGYTPHHQGSSGCRTM